MSDKSFVDTNILIYGYSETEPEKKEIALAILGTSDVVISTQVIHEFIWTMDRKFHVDMELLAVLVGRFFTRFKVVLVEETIIKKALNTVKRYNYSYWDSLIISAALESDCSELYSEDMQHDHIIEGQLRIINPFK